MQSESAFWTENATKPSCILVPIKPVRGVKRDPDKNSAAMTDVTSEPANIDVAVSLYKMQIVQLITNPQIPLKPSRWAFFCHCYRLNIPSSEQLEAAILS